MSLPQTTFAPENPAQHQAVLKLSELWPSLRTEASVSAQPPITEQPTLELVRAKLTELSRNGKNLEVKSLLQKFGANSLNQLAAQHYATVLIEAGVLC